MFAIQEAFPAEGKLIRSTEIFGYTPAPDTYAFPEERFEPSTDDRSGYLRSLAQGRTQMGRRRVVITGLARDVAWVLDRTMARIERLGSMFADYRVVLYENDSADATLPTLHRWSRRNSRIHILSERRNDPVNYPIRCLSRAERMAYYRNQYHEYIGQQFPSYDSVIVIDTDLEGGWSYDGVAHTFGLSQWDFVGAYGILYKRMGLQWNRAIHFDAWAFRFPGDYRPLPNRVVNRMAWQRGNSLVPVSSCFGGLGIYQMDAFLASRYDGEDAEHVGFHRRMAESGYPHLFLNPSLITLYGRRRRKFDGLVQWCQKVAAASMFRPLAVWY